MPRSLREIADFVGGELFGRGDIEIKGVSGIAEARQGDLTFLANPKYLPLLEKTAASAVITSREIKQAGKAIIRTDNPSLAFAKVISWLIPSQARHPQAGIHPAALISRQAKIGRNVAIGAYTVVEEDAFVGDNSIIYPGCYIGRGTVIAENALIYANVSIREMTSIGSGVVIHSGAVLGADGFGFINIDGRHEKIPQVGTVQIGDNVEIGANVTIDRARFEKTVIGSGTKIDNLVHIAHNVVIGENSLIIAQAGISGSTVIGKNVTIAGQAGLVGHIHIGDGAVLAAQAGVTKSVAAGVTVSGYPAQPHERAKIVNACIQNLPKLFETVKELRKKIEEFQSKLNNG